MNQNICYNCGGVYEETLDRMICTSCGSTKPRNISSEEAALLYSAFQKLRLAEFADAEVEFDDIIRKYPGDAQAYWGRLLSRYGIKYEEDHDGKKIPTCYSPSIDSLCNSADYKKAMEYADEDMKVAFQSHAEYIERVREEWIKKASKEKPYDIFISFKDSDEANGLEHTADSDELRELYIYLMGKGYRVFFSRESLLDKGGEKYEPYIFNALATAKIMLVYGSKPEYINSVWVKNEWTRYQKRIQAGEKHPDSLLVAYKGFSPKELPIALSSLGRQHLDASKPGFYSDLLEAIQRIMEAVDYGVRYDTAGKILCEHEEVIVPGKAPTCTQSGWTESSHCSICGNHLKKMEVIPPVGHRFSEWTVVKKSTCTEDGQYERVCRVCGEKETQSIPSRGGHIASEEWETVKEATIGKEGLRAKKCIVCGEYVETMILPALPEIDLDPSDGFRYKLNADKETCEITGIGVCRDERLVIPETLDGHTVTGVGKEAFSNCEKITSLIIPDSVISIGKHAFSGCTNLASIILGDSVETVGDYAFYRCQSLAGIHFGESLKTIGSYAFYECTNLTGIVIPNSVTTLEGVSFGACKNLSGVVFGESVKKIGASAFRGCSHLLRVNIPSSVKSIGSRAFSENVLEFRVSVGNPNYTAIDGNLFSKDETVFLQYATAKKESEFTLPESVTSIETEAFADCKALTCITLPASVKSIGKHVFKNCTNLSRLCYQGKKRAWKKMSLHKDWRTDSPIVRVECQNRIVKLKIK